MKSQTAHKVMLAAAVVAGALWAQAPAQGTLLFSDNFDTDSATTVLNFNSFNNWTVVNYPVETVDYIRNGAFGISCFGNAGGCVDLDGSSGNAGRMVSKTIFTFVPGVVYTLTAQVSGNQRGGASDAFEFGIDGVLGATVGSIAPFDPFTARTVNFNFGSPITGRLFVEDANPTGDNVGPILDNVVLSDNRTLPEPGTLGLLALSLAGLMIGRRSCA